MKRNTLIATVTASALLLSAGSAFAYGGGKMGGKGGHMKLAMTELMDTNKDGTVSDAEKLAFKEAQLKKYDADGDGSLNKEERTKMRTEMKATMTNIMFTKLDTDGNGSVSQAEMEAAKEAAKAKRKADRFAKADTNGDGELSKEEFEAAAEKMGKKDRKGKRDGKRGGKHHKGGKDRN